jgi:hypothetical protein
MRQTSSRTLMLARPTRRWAVEGFARMKTVQGLRADMQREGDLPRFERDCCCRAVIGLGRVAFL